MNLTKRLDYIDIFKGICILLVVLGYCVSGIPHFYIYAFHVPLFFMISGYLFNPDSNCNFFGFLKKRTTSLVVPLILWTFIAVPLTWVLPNYFPTERLLDLYLPPGLWFILTLFLCETIAYPIFKLFRTKNVWLACILISIVAYIQHLNPDRLPYNIDNTPICLIYYLSGGVFGWLSVKYSHITKLPIICSLGIIIVPIIPSYKYGDSLDLFSNHIPEPYLLFTTIPLAVFVAMFSLSYRLNSRVAFLTWLGKNTLLILILHIIAIEISNTYIQNLFENKILYKIVQQMIIWSFVFIFTILINKFLPVLGGKRNK